MCRNMSFSLLALSNSFLKCMFSLSNQDSLSFSISYSMEVKVTWPSLSFFLFSFNISSSIRLCLSSYCLFPFLFFIYIILVHLLFAFALLLMFLHRTITEYLFLIVIFTVSFCNACLRKMMRWRYGGKNDDERGQWWWVWRDFMVSLDFCCQG